MNKQNIIRAMLYGLVVVVPGGAIGLVGYQLYRRIKRKRRRPQADEI